MKIRYSQPLWVLPLYVFLAFFLVSCDTVSQNDSIAPVAESGRGGNKVKVKGLESLVVVKNGVTVSENYYSGTNASQLKHVRSVTKSVVAILAGIAIDEGYFGGLDDTIGDHLSGVANLNNKGNITVEQLLTMTGGFQWNEIGGNEYGTWIAAGNQLQYVLDKPLQHSPGTYYNYNTGATHVLGAMIAEASGMSLLAFADQFLFNPLGISSRAWDTDKQGRYYGGHGIQVKATDAAKIGQLVLNNGMYNGQQVVPAGWMQDAVDAQWTLNFAFGELRSVDYGYLWYKDKGVSPNAVLAWGYGGQFVYVVPGKNLVVATTAKWNVSQRKKERQEIAILDHIVNTVVPQH